MKITTISGKEIDTNMLDDKSAEIHEAINNLYNVCKKYNSTLYARVIIDKEQTIGANYMYQGKDKLRKENIVTLFSLINEFVLDATNGEVFLASRNINDEE